MYHINCLRQDSDVRSCCSSLIKSRKSRLVNDWRWKVFWHHCLTLKFTDTTADAASSESTQDFCDYWEIQNNSVSNSKRLLRVIIIAMLCSSYLEEYNLISHHESDLLIILIPVWRLHSSTSLSRFFQETSLTVSFALSQFSAHTILWLYFFDFCKWVLAWFSV